MKLTIPAYRTDAELHAKIKSVSMRLPTELLRAVRAEADAEGMPYERFIRAALEEAVAGKKRG